MSSYFSFVLALKTVDAQMLFGQYFFQCTYNKLITAKKAFLTANRVFLVCFQKY